MHRQLGRDLVVRQGVEQLQKAAFTATVEHHRTMALHGLRPAVAGIATIIVGGRAPDMLEPFFTAHGPDWSGFAVNDRGPHRLHRVRVREVAVGVKVTDGVIDPDRVEYRGHRTGHELTHRKDRPAHPERRQNIQHIGVGGFIDLEPFAGIDGRLVTIKAVGAHRVPVEHPNMSARLAAP